MRFRLYYSTFFTVHDYTVIMIKFIQRELYIIGRINNLDQKKNKIYADRIS